MFNMINAQYLLKVCKTIPIFPFSSNHRERKTLIPNRNLFSFSATQVAYDVDVYNNDGELIKEIIKHY